MQLRERIDARLTHPAHHRRIAQHRRVVETSHGNAIHPRHQKEHTADNRLVVAECDGLRHRHSRSPHHAEYAEFASHIVRTTFRAHTNRRPAQNHVPNTDAILDCYAIREIRVAATNPRCVDRR